MRCIYIGICGIGMGHADRSSKLASLLLRRGCSVSISTYGDAVEFLRRKGFEVNVNLKVEYGLSDRGELSIKSTIIKNLTFPIRFLIQLAYELRWLDELRPSVVLSDTRASTVLAARSLGIPCIVLLNQYRVLVMSERWRRLAAVTEAVASGLIEEIWGLADVIAIADFPPPYSISKANLSLRKDDAVKSIYLGCISDVDLSRYRDQERYKEELGFDPNEPLILFHAAGPSTERERFNSLVERMLPTLSDFHVIYTRGRANGNEKIRRGRHLIADWIDDEYAAIAAADVVVTRSGQTTIAKSLALGKRLVLIPIPRHTEQISNAKTVARRNVAIVLDERTLTPELLREAIERALDGLNEKVLREYAELASSLKGTEELVNLILKLLEEAGSKRASKASELQLNRT